MTENQRTIKQPVSYSGFGIHTGESSTITFHPAPENFGYKFVRTDLPEQIEIPALVDYVVDLSRGTTLGKDGIKVHTVEHVLAALVGLQIDNCRIELSGIEPPVGDGSSLPYVEALLNAGIVEQNAKREYFVIEETMRYTNEAKEVDIVALPTDDFRITVMIDYHNPALGSQHTGLFSTEAEFVKDFAPARTFCFLSEVIMLHEQGLIKGGSLDSAIVIVDKDIPESELVHLKDRFNLDYTPVLGSNGILNNTELRYKNEPARHKLLDMLGDLALAGVRVKAQILAARPGHASNFEFAKLIRAAYLKNKPLKRLRITSSTETIYDIDKIKKILPHRYPFLLVDKVIGIDPVSKSVLGVKNVTVNEGFFNGHFPLKPIMPGVLLLEALAQTGGILMYHLYEDVRNSLVVFASMDNVKFRKPVRPGDQLIMDVELITRKFGTYKLHGRTYVNNQIVVEADFTATAVDKEEF